MSQATMENTERISYGKIAADEQLTAIEALTQIAKEYARERPEVAALWIFGIGFVLGWKLKPW